MSGFKVLEDSRCRVFREVVRGKCRESEKRNVAKRLEGVSVTRDRQPQNRRRLDEEDPLLNPGRLDRQPFNERDPLKSEIILLTEGKKGVFESTKRETSLATPGLNYESLSWFR